MYVRDLDNVTPPQSKNVPENISSATSFMLERGGRYEISVQTLLTAPKTGEKATIIYSPGW